MLSIWKTLTTKQKKKKKKKLGCSHISSGIIEYVTMLVSIIAAFQCCTIIINATSANIHWASLFRSLSQLLLLSTKLCAIIQIGCLRLQLDWFGDLTQFNISISKLNLKPSTCTLAPATNNKYCTTLEKEQLSHPWNWKSKHF